MLKWSNFPLATILLLIVSASLSAQNAQPKSSAEDKLQTRQVIASASGKSIRFASLGELMQMRLEVIGSSGELLFDSDFKPGNLIDWPASDKQGQRLADGSYLCVVTVKDSSGHITRRHAIASLHERSVSLQQSDSSLLTVAQVEAAGTTSGEDVSLTILELDGSTATAVLAHDGGMAHLVSGSGGLSIGSGDFFANKLLEQIRLTAEGNVGIGISNPQAKLDVAGTIRASQGLVFPDGTIQFSAASKTLGAKSSRSAQKPGGGEDFHTQASGTGTQNHIAKWTDNSGTLGDSGITETASGLGIGTTTPQSGLDYRNGLAPFFTRDIGTTNFGTTQSALQLGVTNAGSRNVNVGPSFLFFADNSAGAKSFLGRVSAAWENPTAGAEAGSIRFEVRANSGDTTASTERMRITAGGNVGIGTQSPTSLLDVAGAINTSTQYKIGGAPVLSITGVNNLLAGVGAGGSNTGAANSFFGFNAGKINSTGSGNSFFGKEAGQANTSAVQNSFFGSSAGFKNATGQENSFFGAAAGFSNTTASDNAFFGFSAGSGNQTGGNNSFFGASAGKANTTASQNSFFGEEAGFANTTASDNAFFGFQAGAATTLGNNSFFGSQAGSANTNGASNSYFGGGAGNTATNGNSNSLFGAFSDSADGLANATAIGAKAFVGQSNSLVLGSITGVNGALTDTKVGIGTTTPARHLHVFGTGDQQIAIESSDVGGREWTLQSSRGPSSGGRFEIVDRTAGANRLTIVANGHVGIGTIDPGTKLHVAASIASSVASDAPPLIGEHVAIIENTKVGQGQNVLALRIGPGTTPIFTNNFITFYDADSHSIGAIQGDAPGVTLVGPGNDYAEWLPRVDSSEQIKPGEIVGLYNGHISKNTRGASQVMAVSTGPIVAGNDPGMKARGEYERVAFIGQVMARVRGTVQAGDFIIASGLGDGAGVAVSPECITSEQFEQVVGQAWETSADAGVKSVRTAVGLIRHDPTVRRLLEYSRHQVAQIAAMDARLTAFESKVVLINAAQQQQAQIKTQQLLIQQRQSQAKQQEAHLAQQRAAMLRQQADIDGLKRLVCAGHSRAAICKRRQ